MSFRISSGEVGFLIVTEKRKLRMRGINRLIQEIDVFAERLTDCVMMRKTQGNSFRLWR